MNPQLPLPLFLNLTFPKAKKKTGPDAAPQKLGNAKVQQVDCRNLPEPTKALLERLLEASNTVQINHCLCLDYYGDGKDFNLYYRVILQRLASTRRPQKRKIHERDTSGYSKEVYTQAKATLKCIFESFRKIHTEGCVYHAYLSILQDRNIEQQHRIELMESIENKAMRFWLLKSLQAALSDEGNLAQLVDIGLKMMWANLEREPSPLAEELLYKFLDTEPEEREAVLLPILQTHISHQGEKMDWIGSEKTRCQMVWLLQALEIDLKTWSDPFTELASDHNLPLEVRLYCFYYVLDQESYTDLQTDWFSDSSITTELEFFRAFLPLGYESSFIDFLNESPENASLKSFDRFYNAKLKAIQALVEFYECKEAFLIGLEGHPEEVKSLRERIANLYHQNIEINATYHLYKIILEKRACACSLEAILEEKKASLITTLDTGKFQGQYISLNEQAYIFPKILEPEWIEGYEDITFDFFIEKIKAFMNAKQDHQALTVSDATLHQDYRGLFQNWNRILTHPDYKGIKTLLDVQAADDNPYVLKLTALAAGIIQLFEEGETNEQAYDRARSLMDMLVLNAETCHGGQLQAIDQAYALWIEADYKYIADSKERALNIVLNSLYVIRKNWVMEEEVRYTEKGKMVAYSPKVADGVFIQALSRYLDIAGLMEQYSCSEKKLASYTFLKNRGQKKDTYGRTHIGYNILGIAGEEMGLSPKDTPPVYDFNLEAESWFLDNAVSDKVSILSAFVESFSFENIWEALAQLVWKKAAEASNFDMLVYKDEACTKTLNLDIYEDVEGIIARQDPLAKGMVRFLNNLGLSPDACCETMLVYYKDELYQEINEATIYARFTKEGIALILDKLGFLRVEDRS